MEHIATHSMLMAARSLLGIFAPMVLQVAQSGQDLHHPSSAALLEPGVPEASQNAPEGLRCLKQTAPTASMFDVNI